MGRYLKLLEEAADIRNRGETEEDIGNVEAWSEIIADALHHVAPADRIKVLRLAVQNEETARADREKHGGLHFMLMEAFTTAAPDIKHLNAIMRLKSLLVQVFVRDITNDNSPERAAEILFAHHRYGMGSGDLSDYLDNLPRE
jgi:hypothetical protein